LMIQASAFAFFHINIIGFEGNFFVYFLFAVIATILVYGTKSIAAEWSLHGLNNAVAFISGLM
jgi:membrane protease YdiL (CAAX protease family)